MPITMLKALWNYRGFILGNVKREFQSKYRNSLLGAAWTILSPLAMIVVYTVIFAQVMKTKLIGVDGSYAYSIYLCSGMFTWGLFAEIINTSKDVFIQNGNLLKKINFPRVCLPVIVVLNSLVNFLIVFSIFFVFLIMVGKFPGLAVISLIPVLFIMIMFATGLGLVLGVLNVFIRDVGQFINIVIQFWFWLTPVVYSQDILPKEYHEIMDYNPMVTIISAFQNVFLNSRSPDFTDLLPFSLWTLILCAMGLRLFRKYSGEIVDEL